MLASFFTDHLVEAGCDEAGRGCLAGPVVAAAVILPKLYQHSILNDSKKLSPSIRQALAIELKNDALAWAIGVVSNDEIDEINILKASFLAMHRAIDQLQLKPELLLIDGNRFTPYPVIHHQCIVGGDAKYLSIAAASILAKTYRDEWMSQLAIEFPQYGWARNAAYPTRAHRQAIKEHGITKYHRKTFQLLAIETPPY